MAHYYKLVGKDGAPYGVCVNSGESCPDPLPEGYVEINFEEYLMVCKYLNIEE